MLEQTLKGIVLAVASMGVAGCVTEAYYSQARDDAKSWIGHPIQDVIKRYGEPKTVKGDAQQKEYRWVDYTDYSYDYEVTHHEQGPEGAGPTVNGENMVAKTTTATKSGYYTCISVFVVDASGVVTDATAKGECQ